MYKYSWLIACFFTISLSAQDKLVVMGKVPNTFVVHTANGMETLQNISTQLGLSVKKLSAYNRININASVPLAKGTEIKIPLTKDNLLQLPADNSAPVYHIIKKGDNLYRLSQEYNKVPPASIREWNHLKKDIVKNGQSVIIGYMVNAKGTVDKKTEASKDIPDANTVIVAPKPAVEEKKNDKKEAVIPPAVKKETPLQVIAEPKLEVKDSKIADDKKLVTDTKAADIKQAAPLAKKKDEASTDYTPKEGDEGFFARGYADHSKEQTQQFRSGDAATFKTISGWTDRKFYVLMNDVPPQTIVRITGTSNKTICAMVLGPLQETKGASGLLLRVSNSAASALGLIDQKFTVTVTYFE